MVANHKMENRTLMIKAEKILQNCIDKKAHLAGKRIHCHILRADLFENTFLSNRLIELYSKCSNSDYAYKLFKNMNQKNIYSWNAMLSDLCRVGNLGEAHQLFEEMPERNVASWNTLISALVHSRFEQKALNAYAGMTRDGFVPTHFTLASVLSACATMLDVEQGRRCHGLVVRIGLATNMYVSNALLNLYVKCRQFREAGQIFDKILDPNEVTFTTIIRGLAEETDGTMEALKLFRLMRRKGVHLDSVSLSSVLHACARTGREESDISRNLDGEQVHGLVIKHGFESDLHAGNSLLDMYAKNRDMKSAETIFAHLPECTTVSWNIMILGYGQAHQSDRSVEYLQNMRSHGIEPDEVTCVNILTSCVRNGDVELARNLFDEMQSPCLISHNAILSGYLHAQNHQEVANLFRRMQFDNVQADRTTIAILLSTITITGFLEAGKQTHGSAVRACLHHDAYVANGLIDMYAKGGYMSRAKRLFESTPGLDTACWNSMITGFTLNSRHEEAFATFKKMRENMLLTEFSYSSILSCSAKFSSSFQGRQVHVLITKEGLMDDLFVGSALIDMYCKCGAVDHARKYFDTMHCKTVIIWNEMIHGYAQDGLGNEAVSLYETMVGSGAEPDRITFTSIMTACSHSGLVDTGLTIFNSMQKDHMIEPGSDHYTCVIDGLCRAGRFQEAEMITDAMPHKDDPIVWEVILSSCRVHANVTLAKRAADELLRLAPHNSAAYLLLANIYSSLGRWDEAMAARDLMRNHQVFKIPGYSRGT